MPVEPQIEEGAWTWKPQTSDILTDLYGSSMISGIAHGSRDVGGLDHTPRGEGVSLAKHAPNHSQPRHRMTIQAKTSAGL